MALSMAAQEVVRIRQLMTELTREEQPPTVLWEDNQGAIGAAKNPVFSKRTYTNQVQWNLSKRPLV